MMLSVPLCAGDAGLSVSVYASRTQRAFVRYATMARARTAFPRCLPRAATAAELARADRMLRRRLPDEVRDVLALANGSGEQQILPGWMLLSADRLAAERRTLRRTWRVSGDAGLRDACLPIGSDGVGNYLCVFVSGGAVGVVAVVWREETAPQWVARSLAEYFEALSLSLERGEIAWDEDWGGMYRLPRSAGGDHDHD